ncbi:ABC transporter permease [Pseudoclavibacter chungangensis]|uniref:ABC transporter permease n=1 Tax=Pseudoclavibacter chungangensis TaxID=587635 RepID=A0A7J5BPT1_9MICO|nr:ABC transporter permease [Pseudoclavibacter chungangensis]KAB1655095.1 ABC transporter permease [Pseudoclavibacter chungangensis]NYJ66135.1 putative ABC transport system permease protein [Pseudoclavibacter chungangensis]
MIGAFELGMLYAVMALGVYLTFRVLNFPDLTVDGSFTTGGAVAASLIAMDTPPVLATLAGVGAGAVAGFVTGLLYTKGRIDGLLAGILTMIALWSINLRIMGVPNKPVAKADGLFGPLVDLGMGKGPWIILIFFVGVLILKAAIDWFLSTDLGLAIQATGNNEQMIRSFGVNTHNTTILTLMISNGLVAGAGALVAQYQGYADISMGVGLILIGLASVIIGQAIFGNRTVLLATFGVIVGAVLYRLVIFAALSVGLNPNDMRLLSAIMVVIALLLPRLGVFSKRLPKGRLTKPPIPSPEGEARATTAAAK